jgi:hypothetical protein
VLLNTLLNRGGIKFIHPPLKTMNLKSLKHFNYIPKTSTEAREFFLTYIRTLMFFEMRKRDVVGTNHVHVSVEEIEYRFFRRPRFHRKYEIEFLRKIDELDVKLETSKNGHQMFVYKALKDGPLDFSLILRKSMELDDLSKAIKAQLLDIELPIPDPSEIYFSKFLEIRHEYLDIFFIKDCFSGRIHTPFSNLKKECRSHITLKGDPVESLDVATMQPLLLGKILKDEIGQNDFTWWIDSGQDIYLMLKNKLGLSTRDEAKDKFYEILYSAPSGSLDRVFGGTDWVKWVNKVKSIYLEENPHTIEKQYSNLAWMLQKSEVNIMTKVWQGLHDAEIPFLTVHDEITIRRCDLQMASHIFHEILKEEFVYFRINQSSKTG